jgi:hypothetical protein
MSLEPQVAERITKIISMLATGQRDSSRDEEKKRAGVRSN